MNNNINNNIQCFFFKKRDVCFFFMHQRETNDEC